MESSKDLLIAQEGAQFLELLKKNAEGEVTWSGKRIFHIKGAKEGVSLDQIIKIASKKLSDAEEDSRIDLQQYSDLAATIRNLDLTNPANKLANRSFTLFLHKIRHFFGSLFFNREEALHNIEDRLPKKRTAYWLHTDGTKERRKGEATHSKPPAPIPPEKPDIFTSTSLFNDEYPFIRSATTGKPDPLGTLSMALATALKGGVDPAFVDTTDPRPFEYVPNPPVQVDNHTGALQIYLPDELLTDPDYEKSLTALLGAPIPHRNTIYGKVCPSYYTVPKEKIVSLLQDALDLDPRVYRQLAKDHRAVKTTFHEALGDWLPAPTLAKPAAPTVPTPVVVSIPTDEAEMVYKRKLVLPDEMAESVAQKDPISIDDLINHLLARQNERILKANLKDVDLLRDARKKKEYPAGRHGYGGGKKVKGPKRILQQRAKDLDLSPTQIRYMMARERLLPTNSFDPLFDPDQINDDYDDEREFWGNLNRSVTNPSTGEITRLAGQLNRQKKDFTTTASLFQLIRFYQVAKDEGEIAHANQILRSIAENSVLINIKTFPQVWELIDLTCDKETIEAVKGAICPRIHGNGAFSNELVQAEVAQALADCQQDIDDLTQGRPPSSGKLNTYTSGYSPISDATLLKKLQLLRKHLNRWNDHPDQVPMLFHANKNPDLIKGMVNDRIYYSWGTGWPGAFFSTMHELSYGQMAIALPLKQMFRTKAIDTAGIAAKKTDRAWLGFNREVILDQAINDYKNRAIEQLEQMLYPLIDGKIADPKERRVVKKALHNRLKARMTAKMNGSPPGETYLIAETPVATKDPGRLDRAPRVCHGLVRVQTLYKNILEEALPEHRSLVRQLRQAVRHATGDELLPQQDPSPEHHATFSALVVLDEEAEVCNYFNSSRSPDLPKVNEVKQSLREAGFTDVPVLTYLCLDLMRAYGVGASVFIPEFVRKRDTEEHRYGTHYEE